MVDTTTDFPPRDRAAMIFGGLGLVSGLLSAFIGYEMEAEFLKPIAWLFFLEAGVMPIGIFFAMAMALGARLATRRSAAALIAFIATMYAWSGAIHIAIRLQRTVGDDAHLIAASLAAGAFGAGLTHLGASAGLPFLRRFSALALTCVVGAVLGLLFYAGERKLIDPRALVLVWQPAVAFVIGLGAARPAPH